MAPRMRTLLVVLALGLALAAAPAVPAAAPDPLAAPEAAADCMGLVCDLVNHVCWVLFRAHCLG